MLIDCHYLGIDNLVALRGDAMKHESSFIPTKGGHKYASELVSQVKNLNEGKFLHDHLENPLRQIFVLE